MTGVSRVVVEGAADSFAATVQDMTVDLGCRHVAVTEEFLDRADIVAVLEEVRGEAVSQAVAGGGFDDAGLKTGFTDRALKNRLMEMVSSTLSGHTIDIVPADREHPLPAQLLARVLVLSLKRIGKTYGSEASSDVGVVLVPDSMTMT
jgi:hypothetical protein